MSGGPPPRRRASGRRGALMAAWTGLTVALLALVSFAYAPGR